MSTIYLIRHGKTEANERHLYCGSTDLSLSAAGIAELKNLSYHIKNVRFITSGMKRTDETLNILFGDVTFRWEPRLREMDFGIFELRSYEELQDTTDYQAWLTGDNESNLIPGGESGTIMQRRVLQAFAELIREEQDTVIVTHGGVIAAIMAYLFPDERKNRNQWQPKPGHGYTIKQNKYQQLP